MSLRPPLPFNPDTHAATPFNSATDAFQLQSRGLPDDVIDALPVEPWSSVLSSKRRGGDNYDTSANQEENRMDDDSQSEDCAVCRMAFEEDDAVTTLPRCRHRARSLTLVPIRPRRRGGRRSLRTFSPGVSLRPGSLAFNPDTPRRLSTPLLTPFNCTPISTLVWTITLSTTRSACGRGWKITGAARCASARSRTRRSERGHGEVRRVRDGVRGRDGMGGTGEDRQTDPRGVENFIIMYFSRTNETKELIRGHAYNR